MNTNKTQRIVLAFGSTAEEADRWYNNRNIHAKQLLASVTSGEARILTKRRLRERFSASEKPAPPFRLRGARVSDAIG